MIQKLQAKANKILFCYRHSGNLSSFVSILANSKKLRWSKSHPERNFENTEPVRIDFNYAEKKRQLFLRTFAGDFDIFYEVLFHETYKISIPEKGNIKTIVDLGSNIGLSALYFLKKFPGSTIFCVEPDPDNFKLLKKNLWPEINSRQAICINAGISAEDGLGKLEFTRYRQNTRISTSTKSSGIEVSLISLNKLIAQNNILQIDLLKIDIEGGEADLFKTNLQWLSAVRHLLIEFHSKEIEQRCIQILRENSFKVEPMHKSVFHAQRIIS